MEGFYEKSRIVFFSYLWKDIKGNNHKKEAAMPSHKLDVYFLSSLFFRITEGNNISIAWQ
jgi:hypothetical protein